MASLPWLFTETDLDLTKREHSGNGKSPPRPFQALKGLFQYQRIWYSGDIARALQKQVCAQEKSPMIDLMKKLAREMDICVLATVSGRKPHCSLMAYTTDEDCSEIYMATHRSTRKFKNLTENPSVSLLIDTREEHKGSHRSEAKALTVSGVFQRLEDNQKRAWVKARLLSRHPHIREFLDHPDAEVIRIKIQSFLLLEGLTDAHFEEIPE
jgi:nitroimidazol reductase NimA-like FMN-containing flavoprotein (pyridoxamine 5'-phosphate oxidase superfamily)